ncbi:MAG: hypothetical protein WCP35_03060 [Verrucomicrobiota bacterium]
MHHVIIINILCVVAISASIYSIFDFFGPRWIWLKPDKTFNIDGLRAKELIVQEFDNAGNLWASRAMVIYRHKPGENGFERIGHVPTGFSYLWLSNFRLFRFITNRSECIELTITGNGQICVLSGGYIWHSQDNGLNFHRTLKLDHYGFGIGRGILCNGLLSVKDNMVYFGEYFRNKCRTHARIYRSHDNGLTWEVAYVFEPGMIKHIHALQEDPYTGKLWICAGDSDNESMIGWSDDNFSSITVAGQGSQSWRTCQLVFTEDFIYWGADTGSINSSGIYRMDKGNNALTKIADTHGSIMFGTRLSKGTIVFSSGREGFPNERDNKTRLFAIDRHDNISVVECGSWKYKKKGLIFRFATLRLQRTEGAKFLVASVLNQKEVPDGEMLIIPEDSLAPSV